MNIKKKYHRKKYGGAEENAADAVEKAAADEITAEAAPAASAQSPAAPSPPLDKPKPVEDVAASAISAVTAPVVPNMSTTPKPEENKQNTDVATMDVGNLFAIIKETFKEFLSADKKISIPALIGLLTLIVTSIIGIVYIFKIYTDYSNATLVKTPLNIQSIDYNLSRGISFNPKTLFNSNIKYKFVLFVILPLVAFVCGIISLYFIYKSNVTDTKVIILAVVALLILQGFISIIVNIGGFYMLRKQIFGVQDKIAAFDNYVYLNFLIDKNFLYYLENVPSNSYVMMKAIISALDSISPEDKQDPNTIAKALFTINIYIHIQKMGHNNDFIQTAFNIFNYKSLSSNFSNFNCADFLYKQPILIKNYSSQIIEIYNSRLTGSLTSTQGSVLRNSGTGAGTSTATDTSTGVTNPMSLAQTESNIFSSLFSFSESFENFNISSFLNNSASSASSAVQNSGIQGIVSTDANNSAAVAKTDANIAGKDIKAAGTSVINSIDHSGKNFINHIKSDLNNSYGSGNNMIIGPDAYYSNSISNVAISADVFNQAKELIDTMLENLNVLVFKFNPESGFMKFISLLVIIIIISLLPIKIFFKIKKNAWSIFTSVLGTLHNIAS